MANAHYVIMLVRALARLGKYGPWAPFGDRGFPPVANGVKDACTNRKKPVVVEAFRYWLDPRPEWFCDKVTAHEIVTYATHCDIRTLEGVMRGEVGDYIIQDVKGEIYPCKPDIFEATYAWVEDIPWRQTNDVDTDNRKQPHA